MRNGSMKKVWLVLGIIACIIAIVLAVYTAPHENTAKAASESIISFVGYGQNIGSNTLKEATKNSVHNDNAPSMTVLVHGLNEDASVWSRKVKELVFDENSLIERLANGRTSTVVYLAKMRSYDTLDFQLKELLESDYEHGEVKTSLNTSDLNKHIIIVFEGRQKSYIGNQLEKDYTKESNVAAYAELDYVIDKLTYDLEYLGVETPRINLIGYGRGGLVNMLYATEHPYNIAGLYSIGTPYNGSNVYDVLDTLRDNGIDSLDIVGSDGGEDIASQSRINEMKLGWNNIAAASGIDAHAIGGAMKTSMLDKVLDFADDLLYLKDGLLQAESYQDIKDVLDDYEYNGKYGELFLNSTEYTVFRLLINDKAIKGDDTGSTEDKTIINNALRNLDIPKIAGDILGAKKYISTAVHTIPYIAPAMIGGALLSPVVATAEVDLLAALIAGYVYGDVKYDGLISDLSGPVSKVLKEFKLRGFTALSEGRFRMSNYDEIILGDGYVHLSSQLGEGYNGFSTYTKLFNAEGNDLFKLADTKLPLPLAHNLETQDGDVINYICNNIDMGLTCVSLFSRYNDGDGLVISGLRVTNNVPESLVIPSSIDGVPVVGIADNAFRASRNAAKKPYSYRKA